MTEFNPNILKDPLGGIDMKNNIPACLLELTKDALSLLPGGLLAGISTSVSDGKNVARSKIATVMEAINDSVGIVEFDTLTGKITFVSDDSQGMSDNWFTNIISVGAQIVGGGQALWQAGQDISDALAPHIACIEDYMDYLKNGDNKTDFSDKGSAEKQLARTQAGFYVFKAQIDDASDFIDDCDDVLEAIAEVFAERTVDPSLIPIFSNDKPTEEQDPIFRLTFGPPKAKKGQYLLSVDGIYYDSQERLYTSGMDVPTTLDLQFIPAKDRWTLDHSPNLGGRGTSYSINDLNKYVDTIFDLDKIDNSKDLQRYYDADHFLQVLYSHRNQSIDIINKNIVDIQAQGYLPDTALYTNYIQQLKSENAAYMAKINKRKKQIEVAVMAPSLFGAAKTFSVGTIPVNDFSYLSSINLDVEISKQKNLVFDHGEVSGIILPIVPLYTHSDDSTQKVVLTPLEVAPVGVASVVDGEEVSGVAPIISLTTNINIKDLIAVYNFADVNIEKPDSLNYNTLNCIALGTENRAQTVSDNLKLLYQKGLTIPYLNGIPVKAKEPALYEFTGDTWSTYPFEISGVGNYVKLPDTSSFQNLLYNPKGTTIDLWTHIPGLKEQRERGYDNFSMHMNDTSAFNLLLSSDSGMWTDLHYYRVLLGCENTGGDNLNIDQSAVVIDRSSNNVRGMIMGFSRDPRMYYEDGIVQPGSTDLNPRENFGGYITSVSALFGAADSNNDNGIWTLSSAAGNPLPVAARQASGTWKSRQVYNPATCALEGDSVDFTVTDPGDKYTVSSNDACCMIYVSGSDSSFSTPSSLSSLISVAPYNGDSNVGTQSSVFFIAPTQSYNTSAVGFVKNSDCRTSDNDILKFVVSTEKTVGGVSFADIISKFVNLQIVFDPPNNSLKFYVNGVLFKEQSLPDTFGTSPYKPPQLPSFMIPPDQSTSSFYYSKPTVTQSKGITSFDSGPDNDSFFTPWIVGGGWTDGRNVDLATSSGGFLDTGAGIISCYNGYVGSLKFYQRALNTTEILKNYNAQKIFFENMDI